MSKFCIIFEIFTLKSIFATRISQAIYYTGAGEKYKASLHHFGSVLYCAKHNIIAQFHGDIYHSHQILQYKIKQWNKINYIGYMKAGGNVIHFSNKSYSRFLSAISYIDRYLWYKVIRMHRVPYIRYTVASRRFQPIVEL